MTSIDHQSYRARQRRARSGIRARPSHRIPRDGLLEVRCWCEWTTVRVTPEEIRAGQTRSCGLPDCQESGL